MSLEYTLAVTSCNRFDLLERTLESFFAHVDVAPSRAIILEDGPRFPDTVDSAVNPMGPFHFPCGIPFTIDLNEPRIGQIRSCDRLMGLAETEWVFWCEDDWLFKEGDFIAPSYDILRKYPEIFTVSLRGRAWNHPLREYPDWPFLIAEPNWSGGWGSMAFNPGLRRKSDWVKMGPYAQAGTDMYACQSELALSKKYLAAGYRIADLGRPIIEHLGHGRSKTKEQF